jgi:hypothetical protein
MPWLRVRLLGRAMANSDSGVSLRICLEAVIHRGPCSIKHRACGRRANRVLRGFGQPAWLAHGPAGLSRRMPLAEPLASQDQVPAIAVWLDGLGAFSSYRRGAEARRAVAATAAPRCAQSKES